VKAASGLVDFLSFSLCVFFSLCLAKKKRDLEIIEREIEQEKKQGKKQEKKQEKRKKEIHTFQKKYAINWKPRRSNGKWLLLKIKGMVYKMSENNLDRKRRMIT
jgi:hypothetical protein